MRASRLSLIVDADHGYGNALNVMRTVEELEHSGVSGMSIEDTALPTRFGQPEGADELISLDEMVGKLKAAVAARRDPDTVILGRTAALRVEGTDGTARRAKAFAECGVDAIFLVGVESADQVKAVHDAARLPIMVGSAPASIQRDDFAAAGARVLLQGHQPVAAAVKALRETYAHLFAGGAPADLKDRVASAKEMDDLVNGSAYKKWQRDYLQLKK
jgi:carboxyvinyl-carboxyphosphonate phosphorylmutase